MARKLLRTMAADATHAAPLRDMGDKCTPEGEGGESGVAETGRLQRGGKTPDTWCGRTGSIGPAWWSSYACAESALIWQESEQTTSE